MKPSVYIETTIPSFYHETRTETDMVARRNWTREWWNDHRDDYELYSSDAVIDELEQGDFSTRKDALELMDDIPLLDIDLAIAEIVSTYIANHTMPADPAGDALHLAIASHHKCDFLLTWNCRHLANAN